MADFFRRVMVFLIVPGLVLVAVLGCEQKPTEGSGQISFSGPLTLRLPPGYSAPVTISGSTLVITSFPDPPLLHYANCFAGVENTGEIGIGAAAGYSSVYTPFVILPVNLNLGAASLGAYRLRISVSDPSIVQIYAQGVSGSNSLLSSSHCTDRGCSPYCQGDSAHYPDQFSRAWGFETLPTVSGDTAEIVVSATDQKPLQPTTGRVNLCNVTFLILKELPPGGITVNFTVELLEDPLHLAITKFPFATAAIISHFQIQ